jgi:hypothetical protein
MTHVVLNEIDVHYYSYLDIYSNVKDARLIQESKFDVGSPIGNWLSERGVNVHFSTMQSNDLVKCIVYANLSEEQQVEYILRFQ